MSKKIKVAFQGEMGAYSHLACLEIFPNAETKACATFEEAFRLASNDSEFKIIIPIENSLAGRVADIHYLIPKYKLQIHAEHFQKVAHNLLGIKGATIKDIKNVKITAGIFCKCKAKYPGTIIPPATTPKVSLRRRLKTIPRPIAIYTYCSYGSTKKLFENKLSINFIFFKMI